MHDRTTWRVLLTVALALATSLTMVVLTSKPARAEGLDERTTITWNMQGESLGGESGVKWRHVQNYLQQASVLLLQETGAGPPSSMRDDAGHRLSSTTYTTVDGHRYQNSLWNPEGSDRGTPYEVFFLQTDSNGGTGSGGRVNVSIITRSTPDEVRVVDNPVNAGRRALGVRFDNHWYFTFHGLSGGGGDSATMLDAIDRTVQSWNDHFEWTVGGDFNTTPQVLENRRDFPEVAWTHTTGLPTHRGDPPRELDYFVSDQYQPHVMMQRLDPGVSDHWPVQAGPDQPYEPHWPEDMDLMAMGDSITHGVNHSQDDGYRSDVKNHLLWSNWADDTGSYRKRDIDMVGSQRSGNMEDRDHEGVPGDRIDEIADRAKCSVKVHRPNVVTLLAGTNDMNQNHQLGTAPERLGDLIDQILNDAPEAAIMVATLPPSTKAGMQDKIDRYNAELPRIVQDRQRQGKHVRLVNLGDLTTADVDGSHPHDEGYRKIADKFHDALLLAENQGWIKKPVPGGGGECGDTDESKAGPGWRSLGVVAPGMTYPSGRTDLADFDGDGRDDYVRVDQKNRTLRIALNRPSDKPGSPVWKQVDTDVHGALDSAWFPGRKLDFADVNGDGLDDIVLIPASDTDKAVLSILNQGLKSTSNGSAIWWEGSGGPMGLNLDHVEQDAVRFADVNGDGRDDYLRVGRDGSVHAYYNVESDTGYWKWEEHLNWAPGVFYGSRDKLRLADVNGDGKADYLMVGGRGNVHAYINEGGRGNGGFTEHRDFVKETGYPGDKSTFRDVSGDGKADYVVVYDGGSVRAWLNRGGNT
ncbi:GDSL-type esterase/lipase family protein [Streptomyces griseus]|uniref:GDSL-type esterase/lipase family protein n=1 Tax=Streptomyces griseus TaxID=1911 RepID=UPI0008409010|nr:GDSL-type esterase/lipase family protein [Streptomyces griseus]